MAKQKKSPKKAAALSKDQLAAVVKRLTAGDSTLFEESKKAGLTPNTPLRSALTKLLGGKQQYTAMIRRSMEARASKEEPQSKGVKKAA